MKLEEHQFIAKPTIRVKKPLPNGMFPSARRSWSDTVERLRPWMRSAPWVAIEGAIRQVGTPAGARAIFRAEQLEKNRPLILRWAQKRIDQLGGQQSEHRQHDGN